MGVAVETARVLRQHAERAGVERLLPVATAALRDAENGPELTARIGAALEMPVRILGGEQEARLIAAAFRRRVALPPGTHIKSKRGQVSNVWVGTRLRPLSLRTGAADLATICIAD